MKIVLTKVYKDTRDSAPDTTQYELFQLETELRFNKLTPSRKPENIRCRTGETLQSYRVNRDWRLITYRRKEGEIMLLLAGKHDEAYRQAQNVRLEELGVQSDISDSADVVHAATPELLTTIRNALGEKLEVFARRFVKPNGEPYDEGSLGVYSTGKKPITDSVDAAFRQALPGLLQSGTMNLDGRPAVLVAIMENVRKRREALKLSIKEFAERIGYPKDSYRQAEEIAIYNGRPRRCTAEYLIPILVALSKEEARQEPEENPTAKAIAAQLDELEATVMTLRQTADALSEKIAALREQLM